MLVFNSIQNLWNKMDPLVNSIKHKQIISRKKNTRFLLHSHIRSFQAAAQVTKATNGFPGSPGAGSQT